MTPTTATHEDANLILRLYELRREEKMRQAREWFLGSFKGVATVEQFFQMCPMGSPENAYFRMVASYWDMTAGFVVTGALNKDLYFRSGGEMLFVWERISDLAPAMREFRKNSAIWSDLEAAAKQMIEWNNVRAPGSYEAFRAMVRGA